MAEQILEKYLIYRQVPVIRAILSLYLISLGLFLTAPVTATAAHKNNVVVMDVLNRKVEIELPIERVITINTSVAVILRALGVDVENKIVGVTSYIHENPQFWRILKNKPTFEYKNPNYEMLAELNPQVIFFYGNSPRFTDEEKLKALGIKWLYLDCFNPDRLPEEIELLGALFGKKKEAAELVRWFQHHDQLIQSRLADVDNSKRPRVFYFQYPDVNLPKKIYRTVNRNSSSHPMIERTGANNLAAGLPGENAVVSAEWIIENNPTTLIAGVLGKSFSGYDAKSDESGKNMKNILRQLADDRALKDSDAVRNNRILILSHDIQQGPSCVIGTAYIAKFLYPERFRDVFPESIAREYYEKWCRLPYRGVFAYPPVAAGAVESAVHSKETTHGKTMRIQDGLGRQVDVPSPLKRLVVSSGSYGPETICALGARDTLVGIDNYAKVSALHISSLLKNVPGVGRGIPNTEKVLELAPQAIIVYESRYPFSESFLNTMNSAGIAIIAMDFHKPEVFERHIRVMGNLLGKEKRAEELIDFENHYLNLIKKRVSKIPSGKRPRAYLESYQNFQAVTPGCADQHLL